MLRGGIFPDRPKVVEGQGVGGGRVVGDIVCLRQTIYPGALQVLKY